jgi:hypothetical protein
MRTRRLTDAAPPPQDTAVTLLADVVLGQIDRARALIDDNRISATFGCADRAYWYYRTLTNFPGATWQQLMLAFACLYRTAHPSNPHYLSPHTAELAGALLRFWAKSQHRDGSFDEWYLNERSYCPTAITSAGAALTLHLMGTALPSKASTAGIAALERAGHWLEPRYNVEVMNQNLAAAVALQGLARLLPGSRWEKVAAAKLDRIRGDQTSEGWFPEYGGMDFGYSTLALDLLAACRMLGSGPAVDKMTRGLCRFLVEVRGAGFVFPGRLGSRGTSHAFSFGAIYFAGTDENAAALAEHLLGGIARQLVPRPDTVDDRYFAYFYLPQFALAFHCGATTATSLGSVTQRADSTYLPGCGLAIVRRSDWSVAVSRRLGGALAIETPDDPPLYHLGYEVLTATGTRYSSAIWEPTTDWQPITDGEGIQVATGFRAASSGIPLRWLMIPFQMVVHALASSLISSAFQSAIKRRMISPRRSLALKLERRVDVGAQSVRVVDTLLPGRGLARLSDVQAALSVSMHSPSGRQVTGRTVRLRPDVSGKLVAMLNAGVPVSITHIMSSKDLYEEAIDVDLQSGSRTIKRD